MISIEGVKKYCNGDITKIENYELAITDNTQTWECHHRLETHNSDGKKRLVYIQKKELIELDIYYNRPPEELIFLTSAEHSRLHHKCKTLSEETKQKISKAGKSLSKEIKQKRNDSHKKKVLCIETGEIFNSVNEAADFAGVFHSSVSRVLKGKTKTTGGYHWAYA